MSDQQIGYEPRVGSVAWRAIEHLRGQRYGAELSTSALALGCHCTVHELLRCLEPALAARAIFQRQKGGHERSPMFWSLVDYTKTPQEGANRDASAGRSHDAGECASSAGRAGDAGSACAVAPVFSSVRLEDGEAPHDAEPPVVPVFTDLARSPLAEVSAPAKTPSCARFALWSDGRMDIETVSGQAVQLSVDETRALVRYLERLGEVI